MSQDHRSLPNDFIELASRTIGAASMNWSNVERAGTFDSNNAIKLLNSFLNEIERKYTITHKHFPPHNDFYDW